MTHKRLCLELICLLLIAVVIPRHSFKIAATRFPRFLPCSSAGTSNAIVNLDSLATPAQLQLSTSNSNKESKDKTRKELIASFLVSEGEYLGSFEWNITEISHTIYSTSYKCTQIGRPGKSVFLKHLDRPPVDGKDNRLRYEFEGMRLFSKYSPRDVPEVILYDEEKRILVSEWLERYVPLRNFFDLSLPSNSRDIAAQYLEVDSDTCRAMGTIMGRSHARTHRRILPSLQYHHLIDQFSNEESFQSADRNLFEPLLETLRRKPKDASEKILTGYNRFDDSSDGVDGPLYQAIEMLQSNFLNNKESLVHAALHCNNVMMMESEEDDDDDTSRRGGDRRTRSFRVINFASSRMGPPGLDLGMFLANFLWYYAGHSEASRRRGIVSGVMAVIDSYKSAFRVQVGGSTGTGGTARALKAERQRQQDLMKLREDLGFTSEKTPTTSNQSMKAMNVDDVINEILLDAIGYMGLFTLFMAMDNGKGLGVEDLPVKNMPELHWGDTESRMAFVRQRQIEMAVLSAFTFLNSKLQTSCENVILEKESTKTLGQDSSTDSSTESSSRPRRAKAAITAQSFADIFLADDKFMNRNQMTEFWY